MNKGKKFDICLMNPPFSTTENQGLDIKFVNKCTELCNVVVAIFPNNIFNKTAAYTKFFDSKHTKSIDLYDSSVLGIHTKWDYVGIYNINSNKEYNTIAIKLDDKSISTNTNTDKASRLDFSKFLNFGDLHTVCKTTIDLHDSLMSKYKSMCDDCDDFIYEENKGNSGNTANKKAPQEKLSRVKEYLKSGKYKYCLYKGSGNHEYDEVQEWKGKNPNELFNGQICWLTNKENVKDNIRYWLECPLADLWRRWYFNNSKFAACWMYVYIPALNFDQPINKFKEYVDSLHKFTDDEIKILKDYNVHNANKL